MTVTRDTLERLREALAKATNAPWVHETHEGGHYGERQYTSGHVIAAAHDYAGNQVSRRDSVTHEDSMTFDDGELIALMRNALPALLDALDAAEAREGETRAALRELLEGVYAVQNDPKDCDACSVLNEAGEDGCVLHGPRAGRLYRAWVAAEEVLGPCQCGHARHEHHEEDSTGCRSCADCGGFMLPAAPSRQGEDGPLSERNIEIILADIKAAETRVTETKKAARLAESAANRASCDLSNLQTEFTRAAAKHLDSGTLESLGIPRRTHPVQR